MGYLIDTHAIIWFITNDSKLPAEIREIMKDSVNKRFASIVSYWEIAIKFSLGRLDLNADLETIFDLINKTGFEILPVEQNHIISASKLEFHHNDPFDRLLIGQAISENFTIITKDAVFKKYDIPVQW